GEEGIVLRLVEAVDLVAEEDGARTAGVPPRLGLTQDLADARHAFRDRAERDEDGARALGDDAGERRLPRPGRAPEDEAADLVALDQRAERAARAEDVLLAGERVDRTRAHAGGERGAGIEPVARRGRFRGRLLE